MRSREGWNNATHCLGCFSENLIFLCVFVSKSNFSPYFSMIFYIALLLLSSTFPIVASALGILIALWLHKRFHAIKVECWTFPMPWSDAVSMKVRLKSFHVWFISWGTVPAVQQVSSVRTICNYLIKGRVKEQACYGQVWAFKIWMLDFLNFYLF